MSGQIVYRPDPRKVHECYGAPASAPVGTLWRCDECGTFWRFDGTLNWSIPAFQRRLRRKYGTPEEAA